MDLNNNNTDRGDSSTQEPVDPTITGNTYIDSLSFDALLANSHLSFDVVFRDHYHKRLQAFALLDAEKQSNKLLDRRQARYEAKKNHRLATAGGYIQPNIFAESAEVGEMKIGSSSNEESKQTVTDHSGEQPTNVQIGQSLHDLQTGIDTQFELDRFFERPISIYDAAWTVETEYVQILSVWDLWSKNQAVRAKLSNYAYFKGNLNVKIAISGTPFHYGNVLISYQPLPSYNSVLTNYNLLFPFTTPSDAALYPSYKTYLSQALGATTIDVKENEPLELEIPFVSFTPQWRLFNDNNAVITSAVSFNDFSVAGDLYLLTLNKIKIANADYDSKVSVNVYAWVTDIQLGCSTGTNINITAEAKVKKRAKPMYDKTRGTVGKRFVASIAEAAKPGHTEYDEPGPVASISSAISNAASALADVPVIGKFAKATSTVFATGSRIANWFGWSRPAVLEKPVYVKNNPFSNGANVIASDCVSRITVNPKQEITVDQSIGGSTQDEMSLKVLASRETYLTTFNWTSSQVAMVDVLWKGLVHPNTFAVTPATSGYLIQPTALCYAATPFQYWRGRLKYRFEFVCSRFHRGKILVRYEPNKAQSVLISTSGAQLNQQNTVIMDLQDSQELEIVVDWAQSKPWCKFSQPSAVPIKYSPVDLPSMVPPVSANFGAYDTNSCNGYLEVRALNELVQPTTTSFVYVNVYVSAEDFEVQAPDAGRLPLNRTIRYTAFSHDGVTTQIINPLNSNSSHLSEDYFGEVITGFRSMLKRFQTMYAANGFTTNTSSIQWFQVRAPIYPSINNVGKPAISTSLPTVISDTINTSHLYFYLKFAYLGSRGSMRFREWGISPVGFSGNTGNGQYNSAFKTVSLSNAVAPPPALPVTSVTAIAGVNTWGDPASNNTCISRLTGTVHFNDANNAGVEFELPYYSPNLFTPTALNSNGATYDNGMGYDSNYAQEFVFSQLAPYSTTSFNYAIHCFFDMATGEDFTFLRFLGAPFYSSV